MVEPAVNFLEVKDSRIRVFFAFSRFFHVNQLQEISDNFSNPSPLDLFLYVKPIYSRSSHKLPPDHG